MERTFMMVKPDGVQRNLIGEVISRFELKGYTLVGSKVLHITKELAEKHYSEHKDRPFFQKLVSFITSGPVFAMVWEGDEIIAESRRMIGKTNPKEADLGTIRGDFGLQTSKNLIHGSDSVESAKREIALFFDDSEIVSYEKDNLKWI
ncbi:nucleoside-diphosphate kinase [Salipaludibacillus sp. HK11]|uniref:nucleoside-diphosphate kinase n=1 Tax=Salipaludibacillus sp. HK11 TaxID=3394320 RepID=UPI0039FD426E